MDRIATKMGTARLGKRENGESSTLQPQNHKHILALDNGWDLVAIRPAVIIEEMKYDSQSYHSPTIDDVPYFFAYLYYTGLYVCDSQALMGVAAEKTPATHHSTTHTAEKRSQGSRRHWQRYKCDCWHLQLYTKTLTITKTSQTRSPRSEICKTGVMIIFQRMMLSKILLFAIKASITAISSS